MKPSTIKLKLLLPLKLSHYFDAEGPGIYHGSLVFPPPSSDHLHPGDGIIEFATLVPYPAEPATPTHLSSATFDDRGKFEMGRTEMPISMALTEWHFVLLYEDRIRVIGLLSDRVVYEEVLNLVRIVSLFTSRETDTRFFLFSHCGRGI